MQYILNPNDDTCLFGMVSDYIHVLDVLESCITVLTIDYQITWKLQNTLLRLVTLLSQNVTLALGHILWSDIAWN
jgi:hypothetical protein